MGEKLMTRQEEMILLSLYNLIEDAYLVNIRDYLIETAGKDWAFGSIYMSLEKLRKRGWVSSRTGEPSGARGGKAIKYYNITASGIRALSETKAVQDRLWRSFSEQGERLHTA